MLKRTLWSIGIFSQERRGAGRLFRKLSEGQAVENVHTKRNTLSTGTLLKLTHKIAVWKTKHMKRNGTSHDHMFIVFIDDHEEEKGTEATDAFSSNDEDSERTDSSTSITTCHFSLASLHGGGA